VHRSASPWGATQDAKQTQQGAVKSAVEDEDEEGGQGDCHLSREGTLSKHCTSGEEVLEWLGEDHVRTGSVVSPCFPLEVACAVWWGLLDHQISDSQTQMPGILIPWDGRGARNLC
jgi:hypothetical protein